MEINEIGEFGLIDRLTKGLPTHNASTLMGPGDDCAVIDSGDKLTLITSQLFMEGLQGGYGDDQQCLCHERYAAPTDCQHRPGKTV